MRIGTAVFVLLLHVPAIAVQAPTIAVGDYLFVRARIVDCGKSLRMVEFGEVDEKGAVTFFENISLLVKGKAIHNVVGELVDALEQQTGYRSKTIQILRVPGSDKEALAKRLMQFYIERKGALKCPHIIQPDNDRQIEDVSRIAKSTTHDNMFVMTFPGKISGFDLSQTQLFP